MKDQDLSAMQALVDKTKEQLINELLETYRRIAELERLEIRRKQAEEKLKRRCEHLEELVKECTAKLTATNEQLQQEITERKRCFQNLASAFEKLKRTNEKLHRYQKRLKSAQEKIIQDEKLSMLYKFGFFVVHDLKNLMLSLSISIHGLQAEPEKADFIRPHIDVITTHVERIKALVARFSSLPNGLELKFKRCDIAYLIRDVLSKFRTRNIKISKDLPSLPPIDCDDSLQVAFCNVIENSIEAMRSGGELSISASLTKKGRYIKIRIADTGHGIPEDSLKDIFKPFETTKEKGFGIGLYQCKEIIKRHKGRITLKSKLNQGTECLILLPTVQRASS